MNYLEECLEKSEKTIECAEMYRQLARDETDFQYVYYASAANYYATRALFHQNKVIIELLREIEAKQTPR